MDADKWVLTVGSAFVGALLALMARGLYDRWANAATARGLAIALWEELSATQFAQQGSYMQFGGFSSQVFDTLFATLATCFPEGLLRAVARYHWKMKFIQEEVTAANARVGANTVAWANVQGHVMAAQRQWAELLPRLDAYSRRSRPRLFITRRE